MDQPSRQKRPKKGQKDTPIENLQNNHKLKKRDELNCNKKYFSSLFQPPEKGQNFLHLLFI